MLKYSTSLGNHVTSPSPLITAYQKLVPLFKMRPLDHLWFILRTISQQMKFLLDPAADCETVTRELCTSRRHKSCS